MRRSIKDYLNFVEEPFKKFIRKNAFFTKKNLYNSIPHNSDQGHRYKRHCPYPRCPPIALFGPFSHCVQCIASPCHHPPVAATPCGSRILGASCRRCFAAAHAPRCCVAVVAVALLRRRCGSPFFSISNTVSVFRARSGASCAPYIWIVVDRPTASACSTLMPEAYGRTNADGRR